MKYNYIIIVITIIIVVLSFMTYFIIQIQNVLESKRTNLFRNVFTKKIINLQHPPPPPVTPPRLSTSARSLKTPF